MSSSINQVDIENNSILDRILLSDAKMLIPFSQVSFTKSRPVRLYAKLNKDGLDDETAERCVNVREQENQVK